MRYMLGIIIVTAAFIIVLYLEDTSLNYEDTCIPIITWIHIAKVWLLNIVTKNVVIIKFPK